MIITFTHAYITFSEFLLQKEEREREKVDGKFLGTLCDKVGGAQFDTLDNF